MASFQTAEPSRVLERFQSGDKEIRLETFSAAGEQQAPSILVLHGATGVEFANRFIALLTRDFAVHGFVAHLLHYFDRTGSQYADDELIRRSSAEWLGTVDDAVTFLRKQRPRAALGIFGYSLGGYLAAAQSMTRPGIDAAVVLAGGVDAATAKNATHCPPTLILHGADDRRVPPSEARNLEAALARGGRVPELHIYPGEGHIFALPTYADALVRSAGFFRTHLGSSGG